MNQNKGIGAYKDRPGYFMGGLIGGAILGALVNKVQGKDWKRGALWGGVTGGLGSWGAEKMMPGAGKPLNWMQKLLYTNKGAPPGIPYQLHPGLAKFGGLGLGAILGGGAAYLAGDPEKDREDQEAAIRAQLEAHRRRNLDFYDKWYTNPWTGESMSYKSYNSGGIANARKGYYNGGAASDEEVLGSEQDRILSITGQSGLEGQQGLEDITETFEMSSGPGQGDMSGWHEMFLDLQGKGEIPGDWDFNDFMENLGALDISPTDFSAQGGYKTRPGYADAGPVDRGLTFEEIVKDKITMIYNHPKVKARGEKMLEEIEMMGLTQGDPETVNRKADYMLSQLNDERGEMLESVFEANLPTVSPNPLEQIFNEARFNQARDNAGEDRIMVDDLKERLLADNVKEAMARRNPMAFRAEGGIADLDMTGGGVSFGPGTGTSDDIPAMLSDGEFVVTAKAVENLGGGDRMRGARRMYSMMNQLDPASQTPAEMSTVGIA